MEEKWLPIPNWSRYEVSDLGRVRSARKKKLLSLQPWDGGYMRAQLYWDVGKKSPIPVHKLVLAAFVGPRPEGLHTRHRNGNKADNRLANLVYGTPAENVADTIEHGQHPQINKTHCPRGHQLIEPNLVVAETARGFRSCLACGRARGTMGVKNPGFYDLADDHYRKIMEGNA